MKNLTLSAALSVALTSPAHAYVLNGKIEQQNGTGQFEKLDTSVPFDVEPIRVDIGGENGFIAAGNIVASHYVFFDSIDGYHSGYVDFDAPILGVAAYQATMGATDFLANTSVNYISTELRGLERGDYVWIDPKDPFRLWVAWAGSSPGDYIRVFTSRSPGV